jgi:hypothetical protein
MGWENLMVEMIVKGDVTMVSLASFSLLVANPFNQYMFSLLQEIVESNG